MTTNSVVVVPAELTSQQQTLTSQIAEIDANLAKLTEQRVAAVDGLHRVEHVIRILRNEPEPVTVSGRKPMSEQARENIRQGLLASAARKREAAAPAAQASTAAPQPAAPVVVTVQASVPPTAATASKKATK